MQLALMSSNLTSDPAGHRAATTVTVSNGVSGMAGSKTPRPVKVAATQIYATVVGKKSAIAKR
jgi:hypothetical protein